MEVCIKNTKLLWLYRSLIFNGVNFVTKNNDLKLIVEALNIKKRKERINFVYDEAIKYINKYYEKDLCKFENGMCIVQRNNGSNDKNGCCKRCKLVTDKGCSTTNMACKLIYCKTALKNFKSLKIREIEILKCFSPLQRIILKSCFFNTREEIINYLYYGL